MCVDYKDLNKACPKDTYPLPNIDTKIDSLAPFQFKCFLDAYQGYHQIQMAPEDEDKTTFHTNIDVFFYTKMPFGLKNAGAIYHRLMDKVFHDQIGRNVEVYVDDIVIKSGTEKDLLRDIGETFRKLRAYNIKLNPGKCSFRVEEGKFLGVVVTKDGLRANPEKVCAITSMSSPTLLKEVQTLNGRLVAINKFIAKNAERTFPFIATLKICIQQNKFQWTEEAEEAFQQLKTFLAKLPTLTAPLKDERLTSYLAATELEVSSILMVERGQTQTPIYYVSRVLTGPESRYTAMENLTLSLVHAN
jgi:hypothetical protein